ncbi:hypothetical protein MVEN_02623800 [Mycena venus]|uniref:BRCT domain-containing protein n=1 Tax=Mycena venus TaxID=2733690 RepID=A0A8H6U0L9_9AGAR|nr:hypothetical protein MVEN_02623800 [Mycena venus]
MHRRGNKSKKVPNVRLRPAQPDAMARARASPEPSSYWDNQETQIATTEEPAIIGGSCPRPFKNVVVCATGVLDKPALFKLASQLGATSVSAFTDRVTHLVAEDHGGAKYLCALERKIPILLPSWISESHRIWQHGDDVDFAQSIATHRLPVFSGVTLCTSGIPIVRRTKINKLLTAAGGTYVKALERPVRVTHVLCAGDAETDEMRYADKFNAAGEADPPIQLVWGRMGDSMRRAITWKTSHAAADDEDELAPVQRLPSMTLQLWGSLLKTRGYEVAGGSVVLSPGKARQMVLEGRSSEEPTQERGPAAAAGGSVLSSFRRANSFVASRPTAAAARELPFGRTSSTWNANADSNSDALPLMNTKKDSDAETLSAAFAGLRFLLRGETDSATVRKAIEGAGGAVVRGGDADYIIVRLISGSALYVAETSAAARALYRTECWLERCLLVDRLCAPDEHASFVPLSIPLPVPGADRITLSFSGLDVSEACWVRRLLEALGITLAPAFSRHATHLLCPSGTGMKYAHALQWGVPVIDMGWLAAMARTGSVPAVHAFLISPTEAEVDSTDPPKSSGPNEARKSEDRVESSSPARTASLTAPSLRRGMSVSPPKIPEHRTKALEDSIVSLLGKRSATQAQDESEALVPVKRGRVHRSRQTSDTLPVLLPGPEEQQGSGRRSVFGTAELLSPSLGSDEGLSVDPDVDEQSLRVVYEDPEQRAEQRRLASLIANEGRHEIPRTPDR